MLENGLIEF
jgi:hypothetical protein